jgi:hypothetical protein
LFLVLSLVKKYIMEKKLRKLVARSRQERLLKRKKAKSKGRGVQQRARIERQRKIRRRLFCAWGDDAYWEERGRSDGMQIFVKVCSF